MRPRGLGTECPRTGTDGRSSAGGGRMLDHSWLPNPVRRDIHETRGLVEIAGDTMTLKLNVAGSPTRPKDLSVEEGFFVVVGDRRK